MEMINRRRFEQAFYEGEFNRFFEPLIENHFDYVMFMRELLAAPEFIYANNISSIPVELIQLFSKLQVIYSAIDPYLYICGLLKNLSFLDGNCCEVGAGAYPRLAELVQPYLKQSKHQLTIYEPDIILDKLDNAKIVRDKFTKETNIADIDTIYGVFPCGATISMIDKAFEEDKNLLLAFCPCDHNTPTHQWWVGKWWLKMYVLIIEKNMGAKSKS